MTDAFTLWLEFEALADAGIEIADSLGARPTENFCNIQVTLADGRRYALNVWTFDYLERARTWLREPGAPPAKYVLPPDIFVERLDRPTLAAVIAELLASDGMREAWRIKDA